MAVGPFKAKVGALETTDIPSAAQAKAFVEGLSPIFRDRLHWRFAGRMLEKAEQSADDEDTTTIKQAFACQYRLRCRCHGSHPCKLSPLNRFARPAHSWDGVSAN